MIKPERLNDYLEHILEAVHNIETYVEGMIIQNLQMIIARNKP